MASKKSSKKNILTSLQEQLAKKNADIAVFSDLLNDYMALYDVKETLEDDIKNRGVYFESPSSSGALIMKHNQSVSDLVMVNKQMLTILEKLGLTTDKTIKTDTANGDDDEL